MRQRQENTVRQQLREWCYEAEAKRGDQRQALAVEACFVPLLQWILSPWQGTPVALALDATTLGTRFTVLAISVVSRGCAIPVAWTILPAHVPQAWRREWLRMLRLLRPAMPRGLDRPRAGRSGLVCPLAVSADRALGLAPVVAHQYRRHLSPGPPGHLWPLGPFRPHPGTRWQGTGTAFKSPARRLRCTVLARWDEGDKDPWLILTDLPPDASEAAWYGLRAWIEQGFKVTKRAGWQWQRTRMTTPQRAARLWLAVAVATLWLLSVGGAADDTIPASTRLDVSVALAGPRRQRRATRRRLVSIFRRGWITILVAWLNQAPLPLGGFLPEPWPTVPKFACDVIVPEFGVRHDAAA